MRAKSCGANGLTNSSRASVGNSRAPSPGKGNSAAPSPTILAGAAMPSSAMRIAIAAPAEWPTTTCGAMSRLFSNPPTACAIAGIASPPGGRPVVKPWPGRSGAITVNRSASSGRSARQLCVAAPVP